ncbi:MAG: site-specific DNA-methyltransferase [Anaerolineales bacterium]
MNQIYFGDNLPILKAMPDESVDLIYIDPPFNTGKTQKRTTLKTVQSENGDRKGFQGKSYETTELGTKAYADSFDNYIDGFLRPRLQEAYRILKGDGSLYFHIDYREVHYCKILLDEIFGRACFLNEIIWAYDYGGRAKSKWPAKHDNILYYVKNPAGYIFNSTAIDREQYIAPGLVGPEKAQRGKLPTDTWWFSYVGKKPTDTWWQTIVPTNGRERLGYPTQKPRKLLDRMIKASSLEGMVVLDFFAGSGTVGESCLELGRKFILIDNNPAALAVMAQRFSGIDDLEWIGFNPAPFEKTNDIDEKRIDPRIVHQPLSQDFILLVACAVRLQREIEYSESWDDSPFGWILHFPDDQKGEIGRQLLLSWIERKGISTGRSKTLDGNIVINGHAIAIRFSTLASNGLYIFQQIQEEGYDYLLCFGISPNEAHCWVFDREHALKNVTPQQSTEYRLDIDLKRLPDWIKGYGGSLEEAYRFLKILKSK